MNVLTVDAVVVAAEVIDGWITYHAIGARAGVRP